MEKTKMKISKEKRKETYDYLCGDASDPDTITDIALEETPMLIEDIETLEAQNKIMIEALEEIVEHGDIYKNAKGFFRKRSAEALGKVKGESDE